MPASWVTLAAVLTRPLRSRGTPLAERIARFALGRRIRPWHLTVGAPVLLWLAVVPLLAAGHLLLGIVLAAGLLLLDAIDGPMARLSQSDTHAGYRMDLIFDRIADAAVWTAIILYSIPRLSRATTSVCVSAALLWTVQQQISVTLTGAGATAADLGPFQRLERYALVGSGAISQAAGFDHGLLAAAVALTVGGAANVVYRTVVATRAVGASGATVPGQPLVGTTANDPAATAIVDDDIGTDFLVQEARDVGQQIHAIELAEEKLIAIGVTIVVGAAGLAIAKGEGHALMLLPFALSLLYCFVEVQHSHLMARGGYKAVLEQAIRVRTGIPISGWETAIAPRLHKDWAIAMVRASVVMLYAASAVVAIYQANLTYRKGQWGYGSGRLYLSLTLGSIVFGGTAAAIATWATTRQYARVASIARAELFEGWTRSSKSP